MSLCEFSIKNESLVCDHCGDIFQLPGKEPDEMLGKVMRACTGLGKRTGPGTELKKLFKRFGIADHGDCGCNHHASLMNARGANWCRANIETIVDWLQEAAIKRDWTIAKSPGIRWILRGIAKKAIRRSEILNQTK